MSMPSNARGGSRKRKLDDASTASEAFPGLPLDVVVTHILPEKTLPDPADLAMLRVVSAAMRDALATTGRKVKELDAYDTVKLRCLDALLRLRRRGPLVDAGRVCSAAARGGHLEVLKSARPMDCPWDDELCVPSYSSYVSTCGSAADNGQLEILKWARAHSAPWDAAMSKYAAKRGHFEMLKWARENGCPWDAGTCYSLAYHGHFEILKWAHENGCPWDVGT